LLALVPEFVLPPLLFWLDPNPRHWLQSEESVYWLWHSTHSLLLKGLGFTQYKMGEEFDEAAVLLSWLTCELWFVLVATLLDLFVELVWVITTQRFFSAEKVYPWKHWPHELFFTERQYGSNIHYPLFVWEK
jgi:hypothetical protein